MAGKAQKQNLQNLVSAMPEVTQREDEIIRFWEEREIFKKTLEQAAPKGEFVFYEGPPTANGKPGIHHLESRAFKDAVLRYRTMRGYHVRRKSGWDTHGIPVELEVEKQLGFASKKDIEKYGVAAFNAKCRESVLRYIKEWEQFSERIAFWTHEPYFTFDNDYIESVWHILKMAHERKLLYKDYKVVPWCPRCGTALSSHEVAQGYEDGVRDPSVYVKFKLRDANEYFLVWTTTPWTLPGNTALAVNENVRYVKSEINGALVWIAKDRLALVAPHARIVEERGGSELVGISYEPLFPFLAQALPHAQEERLSNAYKVYAADFVSTQEGTGIVHTAVMYGSDDFELGTKVGLPKYHLVGEDGAFTLACGSLSGKFVKDADADIIADLKDRSLLLHEEKDYRHTYPFCWRCKTPLLYYARDSWYIAVSKIRDHLIHENRGIHWEPDHIRDGRFGEWLRDLKDWAISRSRYWGTPLPFWECTKCSAILVIGSIGELKKRMGQVPDDLHRPYIDELRATCDSCSSSMRRVPEVLDVWFDSGAMPFAQDHYPFGGKKVLYPADFICEAIDQTRGWFYTLHAIGGVFGRGKAFKHVICLGHVLDASGKKMSKSLGNVVDPTTMIAKYGADALRYFMYTVNAPGDSKNFDERIVREIVKKNIDRLNNVLKFYKLYEDGTTRSARSRNILDLWILAKLDVLIERATKGFERYQLDSAARPISSFIDDLSTWYLRRSRERYKRSVNERAAALSTLRYVLYTLSRVIAPPMPFFAEHLFQAVRQEEDPESVHLASWPERLQGNLNMGRIIKKLLGVSDAVVCHMEFVRDIVSRAHEQRDRAGIRIRQPLQKLAVGVRQLPEEFYALIRDEVNVKEIVHDPLLGSSEVRLDTTLTPSLREEGIVRDAIRAVQAARKEKRLKPGEHGHVTIMVGDDRAIVEKHQEMIQRETNTEISLG